MNDENIQVSVICNTYNHVDYIAEALESFINQKTTFRFEVLVHDDASNDGTTEIVRKYQKMYPDLIFPTYEYENQYSKGISITDLQVDKARGKYCALCEGDDFWISVYKLQKQYDYMQQNPECTFCISNAQAVSVDRKKLDVINTVDRDRVVSTEEVILGGGGFCATNTIFTYTELLKNKPPYFKTLNMDFVVQIYLASCGKSFCFAESMSAYRVGVKGSWTDRMRNNQPKQIEHAKKVIKLRNEFNKYTNYKYNDVIEKVNNKKQFELLFLLRDFKTLKEKKYKKIYGELPLKSKIKFRCKELSPKFYSLLFKE